MIIDGEDDEDETPPSSPARPMHRPMVPPTAAAVAATRPAVAATAVTPTAVAASAASSSQIVGGEDGEAKAATAARTVAERARPGDATPRCTTHALPLAGGRCPLCPRDSGGSDEAGGGQGGPSISASELAFITPPVSGASDMRVATAEPSRAQRRLQEQQQQAAQSLLRATQAHTSAAREQLEATCRAATSAMGAARQGAVHMEGAAAQLRSLTVELRAMRQGTCLESLPPPKFNI